VEAFASVKQAAARANAGLGVLKPEVAKAIGAACEEVRSRKLNEHFVVDMMQGGAGTSTNMNVNEVIANRALEILGRRRGEYRYCHPLDDVNRSQSTNDVYPTATRLALISYTEALVEELRKLSSSFDGLGKRYRRAVTVGRTQLQDAVPMTMGQAFAAYAVTLREEIARLESTIPLLSEVSLGATAIGTEINAPEGYRALVLKELREVTGRQLRPAANLVEATSDAGVFVLVSSSLKRLATKLSKTAGDLRLLSSGPRAGLGEIDLPPVQAGSSIMPGKVNPVIAEALNQVCFRVFGNDVTVTYAAEHGQLQLNPFLPGLTYALFDSFALLLAGIPLFRKKLVEGITVNEEAARQHAERSLSLTTALAPILGYDLAAELAHDAYREGRTVRELLIERHPEIDPSVVDPINLVGPLSPPPVE
jgi:aspartate ammonia-lyase